MKYGYKKRTYGRSTMLINNSFEGETLEQKVQRMMSNKEPIGTDKDAIFTERKQGILPAYNIKTDKWEIAVEAMNSIASGKVEQRTGSMKVVKDDTKDSTEGTQATN